LATLVLVFSPAAFATTLVPMCGEHAETVAAPPPMRASSNAEITSPPCNPQDLLGSSDQPARSPDAAAPLELVPRLPAVYHGLPRHTQSTVLRFADVSGSSRSAFVRELERPPR
jgi:hypothetical protein